MVNALRNSTDGRLPGGAAVSILLAGIPGTETQPGVSFRNENYFAGFERLLMKPEPLIQKLFAIERAIGNTTHSHLRALVIEAQETALRMEIEILEDIEAIRRSLEERQLATLRYSQTSDDCEDDEAFPRSA